jgi:hypothetical protein
MVTSVTNGGWDTEIAPKILRLSKPTDMTIHWTYSDGTISFSIQPFSGGRMHFLLSLTSYFTFRDFMEAERKYKRQVIADRKEQEERRKTISAASDPQAGSRYSSTFYQYMTKVHTNEKDRIADKISKIMNPNPRITEEEPQKLTKKKSNLPPIHSLADLELGRHSLDDDFDKKSYLSDILSEVDTSEDSMEKIIELTPSPLPAPRLELPAVPEIKVSKPKADNVKRSRRLASITPQTSPRRASLITKGGQSTRRKSHSTVPKLPKIT